MKFIGLIFTLILFIQCTTNIEVDLIVHNAKVYSVDSNFTIHQAFAVKNGIFIDIGTDKQMLSRYKAKEIIDANQKAIYPGFYDGHAHSFMLADYLQQVDLVGCKSMKDFVARVQEYRKKNPDSKWILGGGWDESLWDIKQYPHRDTLDKYFPDIPIFLNRIDYHAAIVNSEALRIAQIDTSVYVEGGKIEIDSTQRMTGLLIDNAMALVSKYIPAGNEVNILQKLRQAQDSLLSVGLTSIVDAGLEVEQLELLKKFYEQDSLKIRNYAMLFAEPHNISKYINEGTFESERLNIKAIKLMADGALGSRGARMLENYSDDSTKGFLLHSKEEFKESLAQLANSNFQVAIHAIGDSTNRMLLDLYGALDIKNRRWRIEHAQVVHPSDFIKFKRYQIIPSIQPTHATSDMNWLIQRIGIERAKGAYAYKELLKSYGKVVIGTDFPIEHFNPLYSFHAAVARQNAQGQPKEGFQMENALSREEALRGMTIWAAYGCFQEKKRGSIEKGKDADFIILDDDIMTASNEKLRGIKTLRTVIAGESVYIRQ
ncbi:amidohydrolase [Sphingobacterium bovistauri]|uniref:Amidohydrolase n=1 Tax=Sphingobacterium bovistauri TaxID=2781959 RepID=A0ABS7Z4J2_9SPHI|nr:amidohydrolase [Sphingobacterium bovistauri]MCA5004467.1 amidohydrolase [Sphingobacterium bovistauri]